MRWEAQRWLLRPDQDGRELVSCFSHTDEEVAKEEAIRYAETLEKQGYTLGPGKTGEIWATKGSETFAIRVEERAS